MRWEGEDKLWWVPSKRGLLGLKSFYNVMGCYDSFHFPCKSIWRTRIPLRVAFFVWSKIDKFLVSSNREAHFPNVFLEQVT